jgi:hypothetical protein
MIVPVVVAAFATLLARDDDVSFICGQNEPSCHGYQTSSLTMNVSLSHTELECSMRQSATVESQFLWRACDEARS